MYEKKTASIQFLLLHLVVWKIRQSNCCAYIHLQLH